jgi:LacI family transcriptional regulator
MATIADVARLAGVSLSTVSHVVNGTRPVREHTRAKVLDAIESTGYAPDGIARALRRSRTDSVGLVLADAGQPVFAAMMRGIEREARASGYTLLLANSADDPAHELESVRALREKRVDGLLLAGVGHPDPGLYDLLRAGPPVVMVDRFIAGGRDGARAFDQIGVENVRAMRELVTHLIEQGHRRIGIAVGDPGIPTLGERYEGYLQALALAGIEPEPDLALTVAGPIADGRSAVTRLLRRADRPTAIVTCSTVLTVGALQALKSLGLATPGDIAMAGFDQLAYPDLFSPRITTVTQPAGRIGQQAMRLLLRRLEQPDAAPRTVRLRPVIFHGDSCGCGQPGTDIPIP